MNAPLDDPTYEPVHKPVRGRVPEVVARWGMRSQLRWFRRYARDLQAQRDKLQWVPSRSRPGRYEREGESGWTPIGEYWCHSEHHKGPCCYSCEEESAYGVMQDGWCCCRDERIGHGGR